MPSLRMTAFLLLLASASPAAGQADDPSAPASEFRSLWTGWTEVSREATGREAEAQRRIAQDLAAADAERREALRHQGRELGERVGEIVRRGDCEEGERVARAAGDFALVAAVRDHCRATPALSRNPSGD